MHAYGSKSVASASVSVSVEVRPGRNPIELELGLGGTLRGRSVDARTGEGCDAGLVIIRRGGTQVLFRSSRGDDTGFEITGLEPGIYEIAARMPDRRIGLLGGLVLEHGTVLEGLEIRLEEGATVRVRYEGPHQYAEFRILSGHSVVAVGGLRSGMSALEFVPPGPLTVRCRFSTGGEPPQEREITCEAGKEYEASFVIE